MVEKETKKTFVLDTNVILHDFRSIYNFEENDIVVPIVVLEELDKFKKGNDTINIQAREFNGRWYIDLGLRFITIHETERPATPPVPAPAPAPLKDDDDDPNGGLPF